jgi:hypothetical protein
MLGQHAAELMASSAPVVLAGDYNVAPQDIYPTRSLDGHSRFPAHAPIGLHRRLSIAR